MHVWALVLTFACVALISGPASAALEPFYIAGREGISSGAIDDATGRLTPLALTPTPTGPEFLALSPARPVLYASFKKSAIAFALTPNGLKSLDSCETGGDESCHLSTDRTGGFVFVAHYNSGSLSCFAVNADGGLGDRRALIPFTGSGPNKHRQEKSHLHSVYADPENRHVYACDLGSDCVWIFNFDAAHGTLTAADPPSAQVPPGSGPRHLAFSADGRFVYVANELGGSISAFAREPGSGGLKLIGTWSTFSEDKLALNPATAEIVIDSGSKFLYVSNRGDDSISVFALQRDGTATLIQHTPSVARSVRSFGIDPAGHWLLACGEKDNRLVVLKVDPVTGELLPTPEAASVQDPGCVVFAAPPTRAN